MRQYREGKMAVAIFRWQLVSTRTLLKRLHGRRKAQSDTFKFLEQERHIPLVTATHLRRLLSTLGLRTHHIDVGRIAQTVRPARAKAIEIAIMGITAGQTRWDSIIRSMRLVYECYMGDANSMTMSLGSAILATTIRNTAWQCS